MNTIPNLISISEQATLVSFRDVDPYLRTLSLGSELQKTLVPPLTHRGNRLEAHGQSIPKEALGGDLVDLVASGSDVIAYVADVSGHGLRAGMLMGMIKTAVRYGLLLRQPMAKLLGDINRLLPAVKQPEMFATLAALRFDDSNEVEYVSAGHVPLLHYRRREQDVISYCTPQLPLGLFPGHGYTTERIRYHSGDVFALVTDGVVEVGEELDASLGFERLTHLLRENAQHSLSYIVDMIHSEVSRKGIQHDDQTALLVRATEDSGARRSEPSCDDQNETSEYREPFEAAWRKLLDDLAMELASEPSSAPPKKAT